MDAKSEVILRQSEYFKGATLLVNAPADTLAKHLSGTNQVWTWNYAQHVFFQQHAIASSFATSPPQEQFAQIIIFVPKAKEQLRYVLAHCVFLLNIAQKIYLVGEKNAGIEGAAKQLQAFGKTIKLDSARHCQLWQLTLNTTIAQPQVADYLQQYTVAIAQSCYTICAYPGVFSQKHLDIGTAQLLPFLTQVKTGQLLDFGCGAGVIALALALNHPDNRITAVDIDAFALASTQLTFQANQRLHQLQVKAVTDIQDLNECYFDAVVSNPPFHQGISTSYVASENLCLFSHQHIHLNGELWIVANRFLNYASLIESSFGQCVTHADQHGFKILSAQKRTKDHP